jgi:multiple sugar transport system permease protein
VEIVTRKLRDAVDGYAFILPALVLFVAIILGPLAGIVAMSFAKFDMLGASRWVGLANFARLFSDARMATVAGNTLLYVLLLVPLHLVAGMLLALAVFNVKNGRAKVVFRSVLFFPVLVPTASVALAWVYIFSNDFGMLNYYLESVGGTAVPWLNSPTWVYAAFAIFSVWKFVGNSFIYFFIGLQGIPRDLYEAASIDGSPPLRTFFQITLPQLSPTIFFVLTNLVIGTSQIFDEPYFFTNGGPGDASRTVGLYIYDLAFRFRSFSYGSTVAISLFLVIMAATLAQFSTQKRWVHYGNE